MSSIRPIPRLWSTSYFPSDIGHKGQEQQATNQPHTHAYSAQSNKLTTHTAGYSSKVDINAGKPGSPQGGRINGQEAKSRTLLGAIFARFRRAPANNGEQLSAARAKIDRLQQDVSVLQKRFEDLEGMGYSPYASYRSSTVDTIQGLQRPDVTMSQSSVCPTEDFEFEHAATESVVQAQAEAHTRAEGVNPRLQPHMTRRASQDESSLSTPKQNRSVVTPATLDTVASGSTDRGEGLSMTDKMPDAQPSHTYQHKLPRKKEQEKELDAEVVTEVRPGCISRERLPRKQVEGEIGVETLPSHVRQERLPRKKENGRDDGCSD